eukprot:Clim_evm7s238 gene=Clim_evmTU7s238
MLSTAVRTQSGIATRLAACSAPVVSLGAIRHRSAEAMPASFNDKPEMSLKEAIAIVRRREAKKKHRRELMLTRNSEHIPKFSEHLEEVGCGTLKRDTTSILQVNIGKLCNLVCHHCHVESGPTKKKENMDRETSERLVELMNRPHNLTTLDITGGAPELNPNFRYLVQEGRKAGLEVYDRCNLTVLQEPGQEDTAHFLRDNEVTIVASLPCYSLENVDKQRGKGVFDGSVTALRLLNSLGYGREDGPKLHLVYNPGGPFLPPAQENLKAQYKKELMDAFEIEFNDLFTITNMPIKRFADDLFKAGKFTEYFSTLLNSFNVATVDGVMCRNTLSVSWDGQVWDCDFNQQLELPLTRSPSRQSSARPDILAEQQDNYSIWDIETVDDLKDLRIRTAKHCFACTAGSGSSCGGAVV